LCSLSQCQRRQYHFVSSPLNWTSAQRYCRENHTDLATIDNKEELDTLLNETHISVEQAWIGLYKVDPEQWHWSLSKWGFYKHGEAEYRNWSSGSPDPNSACNSTEMNSDGQWEASNWTEKKRFICYSASGGPTQRYVLVEDKLDWRAAQRYCREKHTDLVSVRSRSENEEVRKVMKNESVWIGLFRDAWRWSDQRSSSFRNWSIEQPDSGGNEKCGSLFLDTKRGGWNDASCNTAYPFICYNDTRELILETEKKSWADALDHCQTHYTGLADIQSHQEQRYAAEEARAANSTLVWLGLRQSRIFGFWFWVNGQPLNYQNWGTGGDHQCTTNNYCGALDRDRGGNWTNRDCEEKLSFICY
ncbi:PLA2R phospholipase, partial [Atractosteus spatula]|nr:PLA2R phospholipase [Atractosteus spatula]